MVFIPYYNSQSIKFNSCSASKKLDTAKPLKSLASKQSLINTISQCTKWPTLSSYHLVSRGIFNLELLSGYIQTE